MAFDDVISEAPAQHLKAMLQALAGSDVTSKLRDQIHTGLGILERYHPDPYVADDDESTAEPAEEEGGEEEEDDLEGGATSAAKKRKRGVMIDLFPVLDICKRPNCRAPFIPGTDEDNGTNTEESCQFHPEPQSTVLANTSVASRRCGGAGELQLDESSDSWEGWIYEHDGAMDSDASRLSNPAGFTYACCDEDGYDEDGCTFGRHLPSGVPAAGRGLKKQRIM
ncbi:hypothetical protein V8F20_010160 [Naviculisporaceae sp. PSN 640]